MKNYNYNYAFVFYDIADDGDGRVTKVFKICKKYLLHHQKSVFRGHISPSNLLRFTSEINKVINHERDFISIIKLFGESSFDEETLGKPSQSESIFL